MQIVKRSEVACYKMSFTYVVGEVVECLDELKVGNWKEAWSELLDVYSCFSCALADASGIDLPLINNSSTRGWAARWQWWSEWLEAKGLEFKPQYMNRGANYKRASKRAYVLARAMEDVNSN